jgi:hypothetical protein
MDEHVAGRIMNGIMARMAAEARYSRDETTPHSDHGRQNNNNWWSLGLSIRPIGTYSGVRLGKYILEQQKLVV